jgi:hypothetical protein
VAARHKGRRRGFSASCRSSTCLKGSTPSWDRAKRLGPVRTAPEGDPVVRLEGGAIEVFGGWLGWDIAALIDEAEIIDGLPFARLEDVLAFKRSYGRPKDRAHVRLIEDYLRETS